ncbi:MAG: hypothetical protein GY730_01345 [bacterium]|nr:hypothetical protein [bacterium]
MKLKYLFVAAVIILISTGNDLQAKNLQFLYESAHNLELIRSYNGARAKYLSVCRKFIRTYEAAENKRSVYSDLPVAISAVFRLSIVTGKNNYSNLFQLSEQMDFYKETHDLIEKMLAVLVDIRSGSSNLVSVFQYEDLLFARAYNRIGWANKLLQGIPWKNYIVFPLGDILGMLDMAVKDLKQQLVFEGISYASLAMKYKRGMFRKKYSDEIYHAYEFNVSKRLKALDKRSLELRTYQLMNFENDIEKLAGIIALRRCGRAYDLIDYYSSEYVQGIINRSKKYHTLNDILSSKNNSLFNVFDKMINVIGIKNN